MTIFKQFDDPISLNVSVFFQYPLPTTPFTPNIVVYHLELQEILTYFFTDDILFLLESHKVYTHQGA